jgi:hypothetical protein
MRPNGLFLIMLMLGAGEGHNRLPLADSDALVVLDASICGQLIGANPWPKVSLL